MLNFLRLFETGDGADLSKADRCPNQVEDFIEGVFERRLKKLEGAFRAGDKGDVETAYERAREVLTARTALRRAPQLVEEEKTPVYLTEYRFLKDAFQFLTQTDEEGFCLATGPELNGRLFALTRRLEPKLERQSAAGAEPEFGSLSETLTRLDNDQGGRLTAYFHSHPGKGAGSTRPSGVDRSTQERFEGGGYPAIGAIFSRDGYVRFFSCRRQFRVKVSGTGGEEVEDRVFKLSESESKVRKVH